ncbi:MAG: sorbosone dehydrogenase family protein [Chromatocurvus sp.]
MRLSYLAYASLICTAMMATSSLVGSASGDIEPLIYRTQTLMINGEEVEARIPAGYRLDLLSDALEEPRLLSFHANGDLFIGSKSDKVYRVPPPYTDPEILVEVEGYPHSVAFRNGEILIARTKGVLHAPYRGGQARLPNAALRTLAELPVGGGHSSRSVGVGPDGRVYLSLGITGNCSDQYLDTSYPFQERRGGVLVLDESSAETQWASFAAGLRNPVGFDWHPRTGVLYASNNGPDHLGYDQPPEYFSRLEPGSYHGMPWFQYDGAQLIRDDCVNSEPPRPLSEVATPVASFPARNAPMGVAFIPENSMHAALVHDAVVALRGSWARQPDGGHIGRLASRRPPAIKIVRFSQGEAQRVDDLVTGFQSPRGDRWARPVGVAVGPDGALYFTSDSGMQGLFRLQRVISDE